MMPSTTSVRIAVPQPLFLAFDGERVAAEDVGDGVAGFRRCPLGAGAAASVGPSSTSAVHASPVHHCTRPDVGCSYQPASGPAI